MNTHDIAAEVGTDMDVSHQYQFNISAETLINLLHVDYNLRFLSS